METENKIEQIREKITLVPSLKISRIPEPTLIRFKELAEQEFCNDYGMLIKHLLDFYDGLILSGTEHIEAEILSIRERLNALENKGEEKPKAIKMASGKTIQREE